MTDTISTNDTIVLVPALEIFADTPHLVRQLLAQLEGLRDNLAEVAEDAFNLFAPVERVALSGKDCDTFYAAFNEAVPEWLTLMEVLDSIQGLALAAVGHEDFDYPTPAWLTAFRASLEVQAR